MATIDRFIADTLREAGSRLITRQGAEISAKVTSRSGRLMSGRHASVSGTTLSFTHPAYERFLDMKRLSTRKKVKRRRIHNRFAYGTYASIADRLMNGYFDEALGK